MLRRHEIHRCGRLRALSPLFSHNARTLGRFCVALRAVRPEDRRATLRRRHPCAVAVVGPSAEMDQQPLPVLARHPRPPTGSTVAPSLLDVNGLLHSPCRALIPSTPLRGGDIRLDYSQQLTPRRALTPGTGCNASRAKRFPPSGGGAASREAYARSTDPCSHCGCQREF